MPPALIITAEYDPLRDEAETYGRRLVEAGATVTHKRYLGMIHGFYSMSDLFDDAHSVYKEIYAFVQAIHGPYRGYAYRIFRWPTWDQFGIIGMAIYQFGIYLLLLSTVNLLFSGMWHYIGWFLWAILIAAISVGTSIAFLRGYVANFFKELLFNASLLQGFMLAMVLSVLFLLAGWLLTRRRPI